MHVRRRSDSFPKPALDQTDNSVSRAVWSRDDRGPKALQQVVGEPDWTVLDVDGFRYGLGSRAVHQHTQYSSPGDEKGRASAERICVRLDYLAQ